MTNDRPTQLHDLKTWPEYFRSSQRGEKLFEIRKNDRDYRVGDVLVLYEFDPVKQQYTGDAAGGYWVRYVLYGPAFCIPEGYCVMSLEPMTPQ